MPVFRYELEQQLLAGDISIQEVPRLWNDKMTEYLGCTPKDDAQGVLQDVHWSAGIMGYFPTYSLGAMYACQIYQVHPMLPSTRTHDYCISQLTCRSNDSM